jgi:hypothetical protein
MKKAKEANTRENVFAYRTKTQNLNYEIIKKIKVHNENKESVGFHQLCTPDVFHKVGKILRQAHEWGMIESHCGGNIDGIGYFQLTVTPIGDAFIEYCEKINENEKAKAKPA